jgi:hypothetical protein
LDVPYSNNTPGSAGGGSTFKLVTEPMAYNNAQAACERMGPDAGLISYK